MHVVLCNLPLMEWLSLLPGCFPCLSFLDRARANRFARLAERELLLDPQSFSLRGGVGVEEKGDAGGKMALYNSSTAAKTPPHGVSSPDLCSARAARCADGVSCYILKRNPQAVS